MAKPAKPARWSFKAWLDSPTIRLAASYLLIIMIMSISFSVVFYNTSSHALGQQLPPPSLFDDGQARDPSNSDSHHSGNAEGVNNFIKQRIVEGRQALLTRLAVLNAVVLVGGSGLSYYLARRTLKPIEDSMEARTQFVSDASHELRTPLTSIQTTNEVALRNKRLSLGEARNVLKMNVEEVEKLKALTDGLLKLASQDAGQTPNQAVALQDVTSEALNRVMPLALKKSIAINDAVQNIKVMGDFQTLTQALGILLDNAVKYSPAGSTVHVQTRKRAKQVMLSVRDEGPGIRPYDLRKIFDRFYRADQSRSTQHVAGHGIGLALAKKIVEQHGGEIAARSVQGKGSLFIIKLPLAS